MNRILNSSLIGIAFLALYLATPASAKAEEIPTLAEAPDTIIVCRSGTYLNGQPFNADTQADGHESWPPSAADLPVGSFRDPEFRAIPTPDDYLVIEDRGDRLQGVAKLEINGVSLHLVLRVSEDRPLHWETFRAALDDGSYLGIAMNSVFWRPTENMAASNLSRESLNDALWESKRIRLQDIDARDHAQLETGIFHPPFERAQSLCRKDEQEDEQEDEAEE